VITRREEDAMTYQALPRIAALLLAAATLSACGSAAKGKPAAAAKGKPSAPGYLFSIPTASGSLTGHGDKHLTLRMTGARDYLTRFTDRPLREAFVVANADFTKRFSHSFAGSKPSAVLTYTPRGARVPISIVLTLGQPRWNARHATWTFPATRIRKQAGNVAGSKPHVKPPVIPNPHSFSHATLLIDNGVHGG
jgi:hypothetical protein